MISSVQGSPAVTITLKFGRFLFSIDAKTDEGRVVIVISLSLRKSCNLTPVPIFSREENTKVPPCPIAIKISKTEASKHTEAKNVILSLELTLNRRPCSFTTFSIPACVTLTPFGLPVVPEV